MPKIAAPTVVQYRAMVQRRLINIAEEIMCSGEPGKLTTDAVAAATGIVRNSIYRYVDSVDNLRGLVPARHLPAWIDAIAAELEAVEVPTERTVIWVRANLQQAARTGHGQLMGLSRSITPSLATAKVMDSSRAIIRDSIARTWAALAQDPMQLRIAVRLTRGLLGAGLRRLDSDIPIDVVVDLDEKAARDLVTRITDGNSWPREPPPRGG